MSRPSTSELRDALRVGLLERLAPDGWREVSNDGIGFVAFVCPVADEFVATVDVWEARSYPDRPPVLITDMHGGVGYEPLRRLAPLLGMFGLDVQSDPIWGEALADDSGEDDDGNGEEPRELRTLADADSLAAELSAVVLERAVAYARPYASLDALLGAVENTRTVSIRYAALLAAAGRFDEATASLGRIPPPAPGLDWMRDEQRAARQLERWIDSGGDPALIPETPPPPRFQRSAERSMSQVWQDSRATSAAVDVVRREGEGKDRAELRAMLERELADRGVNQPPLWYEQTLDHLHDTPADKRELLFKGMVSAGKFGIKAFKGIRDGQSLPDLSAPEWLKPPVRAAWAVPRQHPGQWAEVQIAEETGSGWIASIKRFHA